MILFTLLQAEHRHPLHILAWLQHPLTFQGENFFFLFFFGAKKNGPEEEDKKKKNPYLAGHDNYHFSHLFIFCQPLYLELFFLEFAPCSNLYDLHFPFSQLCCDAPYIQAGACITGKPQSGECCDSLVLLSQRRRYLENFPLFRLFCPRNLNIVRSVAAASKIRAAPCWKFGTSQESRTQSLASGLPVP